MLFIQLLPMYVPFCKEGLCKQEVVFSLERMSKELCSFNSYLNDVLEEKYVFISR